MKGERDSSLEKEILTKYERDLDLQVADGRVTQESKSDGKDGKNWEKEE